MTTKNTGSGLTTESELKTNNIKEISESEFKPGRILDLTDKDERYAYRWLNATTMQKNGWNDHRGWKPVNTLEGGDEASPRVREGFGDMINSNDGTVRRGDLILARMPKEQSEKRKAYFRKKQAQREEVLNVKKKLEGTAESQVRFEQRRGQSEERYD